MNDARPNLMATELGTAARVAVPPEERVAASRYVLRHARSRDDLRLLLDALGLNTTTKGDS